MFAKLLFGVLLMGASSVWAKSIDQAGIRQTIRKNLKDVRGCYEKVLIGQPALNGKVVVDFTIGERGHIVNSSVNKKKSTINNEKLNDCIRTALGTWKFPAPPPGQLVEISYPFVLSPVKKH